MAYHIIFVYCLYNCGVQWRRGGWYRFSFQPPPPPPGIHSGHTLPRKKTLQQQQKVSRAAAHVCRVSNNFALSLWNIQNGRRLLPEVFYRDGPTFFFEMRHFPPVLNNIVGRNWAEIVRERRRWGFLVRRADNVVYVISLSLCLCYLLQKVLTLYLSLSINWRMNFYVGLIYMQK